MKRNLKTLGLALVAALSISAVAASAASADFITDNDGTTILTATALNEQVFTVPGGDEVRCKKIEVDGSIVGTTQSTVVATPTYKECTVVRGINLIPAFVDDNNCPFEFTTKTTVHICQENGESTEGNITVTAEIVPPFKSKCIIIPAQTPTNAEVHYTNSTSTSGKMEVIIESTVEGITWEYAGPCGEPGLHHNAHYEGEVTVEGHDEESGEPVDVTKINDNHEE